MMAAIRAFAKSWVAAVLMGILIISFAIWGVRDIFHPRFSDWVIKAGAREVSSTDFKQAFDHQLQTVQQQTGQVVSAQDAVAAGLDQRMLQDMAMSEAVAELIRRDGIQPSDKLLAQELGKIPAFFNPITGTFDKTTYENLLRDNHLTPAVFEHDMTDRISASQFGAGMQAGYQAPLTYSALLAAFQLQGRSADFFVFDPRTVGEPPKPTDAQLQQYIKDNTARFTRPELRQISLVRFSAAALAQSLKVDPGDVQKQFDFAKGRLSTPERRTFVQVPAADAGQAAAIAAQLNKGADASAVARSLGVKPVNYADAAKSTVADPAVADAAFSLSEGQVSGPIRGQLGFAVVKLLHITPGKPATLEEARPQIEKDLRQHAAEEQVNDQVQKYEDSHDTGALLPQSAKAAGVQVFELGPMTQQGIDLRTRQQIVGLNQKMLADAFSLSQGAETDVMQLGKGEYYALRVDKVLPQAVPPLEEIRPAITMDYMRRELIKRVQARADQLADRVRKGESLAAVAASAGAKVQHLDGMSRVAARQAAQTYGETFLGALFDAKPGGVFTAGMTGGIAVARLTAISPGDMGQIARATQAQRGALTREMGGQDLQETVQNAARARIKPKIDYKRVLTTLGVQPETASSSAKPAKPAA